MAHPPLLDPFDPEFMQRAGQPWRAAADELLDLAGETGRLDELCDENAWFSYETKIALFDAAAQLTGDPHIARQMGAALLRSRIGRTLLLMLSLLGSPTQLLRSVDSASAKFSTVADMRLLAHSRRSATASTRWRSATGC